MNLRTSVASFCLLLTMVLPIAGETVEIAASISKNVQLLVPATEPGVVQSLFVRPGDLVRNGDPLAQIDDSLISMQHDAALMEAELAELESRNDVDLRFAEKSEAVSRAELERMVQANRDYARSISRTEMQQTKLSAERSQLAAEQARKDLDSKRLTVALRRKQAAVLQKRMEMAAITAPADGMVVDYPLAPDEGEYVQIGAPVVRMIKLNPARAEAYLDARRFDLTLKGAPAILRVRLAGDDKESEFPGRVTYVSPELEPVNNRLKIWAEFENDNLQLLPNTNCRMVIDVDGQRKPDPQATPIPNDESTEVEHEVIGKPFWQ